MTVMFQKNARPHLQETKGRSAIHSHSYTPKRDKHIVKHLQYSVIMKWGGNGCAIFLCKYLSKSIKLI